MAYVQTASPNRRLAVMGGVATLHAAALVALVSGLTVKIVDHFDPPLTARMIPADPKPPEPQPSTTPKANPIEQKFVAPEPIIDVNTSRTEATIIELIPPKPLDPPTGSGIEPLPVQPSPTPSYAAQRAVPLGSPGRWATSADYPTRALREGREGVTGFRVTIGIDGRVLNCEVTASSGSSDLDRATCENVAKRARFKPAIDGTGAKAPGHYSNAIRWEIPD